MCVYVFSFCAEKKTSTKLTTISNDNDDDDDNDDTYKKDIVKQEISMF